MGLDSRGAVRPVRFELGIRNLYVARNIFVADDEVVARSCLVKLLLNREPCGFVEPQLNLGKLAFHFIGFWQKLKQDSFVAVESLFTLAD